MARKRYAPVFILLTVMFVVQLAATGLGCSYYLTQLTMAAYYSLVVLGLCLVMGYAGQISLGHAAFFAIGGYGAAVMTTCNLTAGLARGDGWLLLADRLGLLVHAQGLYGGKIVYFSPWLACLTAVGAAVVVAFLVGIPVLRLKGHYLAMATLGVGTIVHSVVKGTALFGEADGISEVPAFHVFPGMTVSGAFSSWSRIQNFYFAWGLVLLSLILLIHLVHSRAGRALRAIHGAENAAAAMGIHTARYKLYAFVLSAFLAALGGVFLTHYNGGIGPSEASIMKSVRYVAIVAVGGMANLWGALVMGAVLNFLSLRGMFGSYDDAVFGIILIVIMLFAPEGVVNRKTLRALLPWHWRRKKEEPAA